MSLPVRVFQIATVYHVGNMDGIRSGTSYEGHHLSVSLCPEAWTNIARLGGRPTYAMTRKGGRFFDMLDTPKETLRHIEAEAITEGLLVPTTVHRVSYEDDETEGKWYTEFLTRAEAEREAQEDSEIEEITSVRTTKKLIDLVGYHKQCTGDMARDFAILPWVQRYGFDGVWWTENYDPDSMSAPRGLIFRDLVSTWRAEIVGTDYDEELLETMPDSKTVAITEKTFEDA